MERTITKRKPLSEETRNKIRVSNTGRKLSKETKEKISKITTERIKKGELGFKIGYKPTEDHLRRLSESHKGKIPNNKGKKMSQEFRDKCRERMLGSKQSPEVIEKRVSQMRGEKHWRWMEDRKSVDMNKRGWNVKRCVEWREKVFTRDKYRCKIGGGMCCVNVEAHHILPWRDYPEERFNINNGITLCRAHHPRKRAEEKRLVSDFQKLVSVSKEPLS